MLTTTVTQSRGRRRGPARFVVALVLSWSAATFAGTAEAQGLPQTNSAPAGALCTGQPSGEFWWNTIWRLDTGGYPGTVGFICTFPRLPLASLLADPRLNAAQGECRAYGGLFYMFASVLGSDPATDTVYSGYGCQWLF
jgi:hypothetical protein